jgi:hypothetical protein
MADTLKRTNLPAKKTRASAKGKKRAGTDDSELRCSDLSYPLRSCQKRAFKPYSRSGQFSG